MRNIRGMVRRAMAAGLLVALGLVPCAYGAEDGGDRIVVDIGKQTVTPNPPAINRSWAKTFIIDVRYQDATPSQAVGNATDKTDKKKWVPRVRLTEGVYVISGNTASIVSPATEWTVRGGSVPITLRSCRDLAARALTPAVPCPAFVAARHIAGEGVGGPITLYADSGSFSLQAEVSNDAGNSEQVEVHPITVDIINRLHALTWTGGFTASGLRDERYVLDEIDTTAKTAKIAQLDDARPPVKLGFFANYMGLGLAKKKWAGLAFGLALDPQLDNITFMLGPTVALRTLPSSNSLHITAGLAYGPRRQLAPEYRERFRGKTPIASDTAASTLLVSERDLSGFVGITFRFAGGRAETALRGVVQGDTKPAAPNQ